MFVPTLSIKDTVDSRVHVEYLALETMLDVQTKQYGTVTVASSMHAR